MARFVGAVASGSDVHESLDAFFFLGVCVLDLLLVKQKEKKCFHVQRRQ